MRPSVDDIWWKHTVGAEEAPPLDLKAVLQEGLKRARESGTKPQGPWIVSPRAYELLTGRKP